MKKFILIGITLFLTINSWALEFKLNGINYSTIDHNSVKVVNEGDYVGEIIIPSLVVFSNVEYTVTALDVYAFYNCWRLTSITIPPTVTSIERYAFYECSALSSITIPPSVTSIGYYAFDGCPAIFDVDLNNLNYSSQDGVLYNKNLTSLIHCPTSLENNFIIPSSVISIDHNAFYKCTALTSITLPSSVISIGSSAFSYCKALTSITLPSSIISIYHNTFSYCKALSSINIPPSVTSIGTDAFAGCSALTCITIPPSVTSIGSGAFVNCSAILVVDLNNLNYSSQDGVLYNKNFTSLIHCPTSIQNNYIIPSSVSSIGNSAFQGCTALTSITFPTSVTSIEKFAFRSCTALTSITLPSSITSIESYVFRNCTALTSITLPSSITSIESYLFSNCTTLTSINIPPLVTTIGHSAFHSCNALTSINIPPLVESIEGFAFAFCSSLSTIELPSELISIGNCSFCYCVALNQIKVLSITPPSLGTDVFNGVNTTSCILYVPKGSLSAYKAAPQWKDFLNIIEFDPTGIEIINLQPLKIYPNPTTDFITIYLDNYNVNLNLSIYNIMGKEIYKSEVVLQQTQLDVSNYPSGIYIIHTLNNDGKVMNLCRFMKK